MLNPPISNASEIANSEELAIYLYEAQRVENAILTQYLFAAMSIKREYTDREWLVSEIEMARKCRETLYAIARDEMVHLTVTCNALIGLGLGSRLSTSDYRQTSERWFSNRFSLTPFSKATLNRMIDFEAPPLQPDGNYEWMNLRPVKPTYDRVGRLYEKLQTAYVKYADGRIFAQASPKMPDTKDKIGQNALAQPKAIADITAALEKVRAEGEGSSTLSAKSHYEKLCELKVSLVKSRIHIGSLVYPAISNPHVSQTSAWHRTEGHAALARKKTNTLLTGLPARTASLFNHVYQTVMLMLDQYYSPMSETDDQRRKLLDLSRSAMSALILPIGELLMEIPIEPCVEARCANAAPPFELAPDIVLPVIQGARWPFLLSRTKLAEDEARELVGQFGTPPNGPYSMFGARLTTIAENLHALHCRITEISKLPEGV